MPHPSNSKEQKTGKKEAVKRARTPETEMSPDRTAETANNLLGQIDASSIEDHAKLLSNPIYRPVQRQSMARRIGQKMGNSYLSKVLVQMKEDEEVVSATRQPQPISELGPVKLSETMLSGGLIKQAVQVPFTQVISRVDEDQEAAGSEEPEAPIHVEEIPGDEDEIDHPAHDSSISSRIGHHEEVSEGGAGPSGFGVTRCSWSIRDVDVSSSFGTIFNSGTYTVTGTYHYDITWRVRGAVGPSNEVDIASDSDSDLKATNYQYVAKDLTPNMGDLGGRPPRDGYWAKDLTTRHELVHVSDYRRTGREGFRAAKNWLGRQTSTSASHVRDTLLPQALTEGGRVLRARMAAPPGAEPRAYGDGAPTYTARSNRIKTKGDADQYGKVSVSVKVLPKGGGTHTVVEGDNLSSISEQIYGHGRYWRQIRDANPGKTRQGGNLIYPGTVLDLPEINVDQDLSVDLSYDTNYVTTPTATVAGGATHEFLVKPKDLFTDATNNSGDVTIYVVDAEFNDLETVTWSIPNPLVSVSSDFEIRARITS
ncbi:MAG: hypothetical protein AMJ56_15280 [Anaerolineae bacterium SG8_19]|jgi:hypothetical protein|nr:MAG: hypothetical protein AMJ56_15280 [Anaerolineae bacterium SG8_19]